MVLAAPPSLVRRAVALLVFGAASTATAQPPAAPVLPVAHAVQATPQVRTVATVGTDTVITDEEVWHAVRGRLVTTKPEPGMTPEQMRAREKAYFNEELRALIERELLLGEFLARVKKNNAQAYNDLHDTAKLQADARFAEIKKAGGIASDDDLNKALRSQGISRAILARQFERGAMVGIYLQTMLKDKGKTISLREVERYYADHPDEFKVAEKVVWLDLFVSHARFNTPADTEKYAGWLLQQARGGADFAGLIREYGHGDSKLRGGAGVGETAADIRPLELAPAVLALKPGQTSNLIPTDAGIHVVKVTERRYAGVQPFDVTVQQKVRMKLTQELQVREKERIVEDLWRKTTVTVVEQP